MSGSGFTAFLESLNNKPMLHKEALVSAIKFVKDNDGVVIEQDGITRLEINGDTVLYSKPIGHYERFCYQFLTSDQEAIEIIIEIDDVFEQQYLEKPRTKKWSHICEWEASRVAIHQSDVSKDRPFFLGDIKKELKDAHGQHGKPLRVVRTKRVTVTESTVIEIYKK